MGDVGLSDGCMTSTRCNRIYGRGSNRTLFPFTCFCSYWKILVNMDVHMNSRTWTVFCVERDVKYNVHVILRYIYMGIESFIINHCTLNKPAVKSSLAVRRVKWSWYRMFRKRYVHQLSELGEIRYFSCFNPLTMGAETSFEALGANFVYRVKTWLHFCRENHRPDAVNSCIQTGGGSNLWHIWPLILRCSQLQHVT